MELTDLADGKTKRCQSSQKARQALNSLITMDKENMITAGCSFISLHFNS